MNELQERDSAAIQYLQNLNLHPTLLEDDVPTETYTKLPFSQIAALGTAFEPLSAIAQTIAGPSSTTSSLYRVTIPSGTHLASFKSGIGNLGTILNADNKIAGQAVLNPLSFNPTMIFMAASLANIDKKLDSIQKLQQEMLSFLVQKERAELRGNLIFLYDLLESYKYNWNNDMYKSNNHIKVLDILQTANQKIILYKAQILSVIASKSFLHSDKEAQNRFDKIHSLLKDYQLALYTLAFSSFLDVMLIENYHSDYLNGIRERLDHYSVEYRELYTKCYEYIESSFNSSIQSSLLKGINHISKATGEAIAKVPVLSKGPVDEALIAAGGRIDQYNSWKITHQLQKMTDQQSSYVRPFIDNIVMIDQLYNNPIDMIIGHDCVYLGVINKKEIDKSTNTTS